MNDTSTMQSPRHPSRVCFVIDNLSVAGTESQLLMLINGLNRAKVQPYLCLLDGSAGQSRTLEPKDCPVLRLGVRKLRHPATLRRAWQFVRFLRRERIDVVQTHFSDSTLFAAPLAKLAGVPHVIGTRRNIGYWLTPRSRRRARVANRFLDSIIANSEACRQAMIDQEGINPKSVSVVHNGIDLDKFAQIHPASANGRPRRIGMVANLRPVKGPDVFIRAAALVHAKHQNTIFSMAGEGDRESAAALARECGIGDRLELLGTVSDIPAFLAQLDVAVLTSHSEGLSNALLEYMAAGRPIVATAVGGNVELVEDGTSGLLVPPDDPEAVARAIERLLSDPVLSGGLATAARERVSREYSCRAMIQQHENFFQRWACSKHGFASP